ncbi:MAG: DNA recombination protein RmuC [bacterium]|nr:DNA recombination protein RmuC [bacterium]
MDALLAALAGLLAGGVLVHLLARAREATLREKAARLEDELARRDRDGGAQRDAFLAVAADALRLNNESFLQLARPELEKVVARAAGELAQRQQAVEGLVKPIGDTLAKVTLEITQLEKQRAATHADLVRLIGTVNDDQRALKSETSNLVQALRRPEVRGRWGELQLRKVVEMAGMLDYVDFVEQASVEGEDGRLRPDMIVRLPGGQQVVVDAKAPLDAYLAAVEAVDEDRRRALLADHARHIQDHMRKLGLKNYWSQFAPSPEFVVMFLPGENIFGQALAQDPSLIEKGVNEKVIPASPTTLIALLRAVAYGWNQQKLTESALEISVLGRDLYGRLRTMAEHLARHGQHLDRSVDSYNKFLGSLERNVLPQARRFEQLGAAVGEGLPEIPPIEKALRLPQAPELTAPLPEDAVD